MNLKINNSILIELKKALKASTLETCGCSESAKKEMKIYIDTWIKERLNSAIDAIQGNKQAMENIKYSSSRYHI